MCVQTITTEQDCLYLEYLDNCNLDRAYPPLRMYETNDFLIIDADDSKQISISKVGFEVEINGFTYTDILEAQRQLATEIQCVNNSRTGDSITVLEDIKKQLDIERDSTYIDLTNSLGTAWPNFPFTVNLIQWNDGTSTVGGAVAPTLVNDTTELATLFNSTIPNNQLEARDATTVYLREGTEGIPTAGGAYVNIQTTTPDILFYPQTTWLSEADPVPSSPKVTADKLSNIVDGVGTIPSVGLLNLYPLGGTMNNAITAIPANENRKKISISVIGGDAWIRKQASGGSVRRGILVKDGGTWFDSVGNDGAMYRDEISIINTADGLDFSFSVTEE